MQQSPVVTYNEALPKSQQPGFSPVYRQKGLKQLLSSPHNTVRTVKDIVLQCRDKFGSRKGMGEISVHFEQEHEAQIQKRALKTYTYKQIYEQANALGKAMHCRQLSFKQGERGMNLIGIYSKNRRQWFVTDWACALFNYTTVPLYDTLGKDSLTYCMEMTGITTLFASGKSVEEIARFTLKGSLKTLVLYDNISEELSKKLQGLGLEVLYYDDLVFEGQKLQIDHESIEVKPEDIYSFCYTSGTTGPPKGALISHRALLGAVVPFILHTDLNFNQTDSYLSYLPLPHLMQRTIANCMFYTGAFLVVSSGNNQKIKQDTAFIQATIFISVPRVFTRIVEAVSNTINAMVIEEDKRELIEQAVYTEVREGYGGKIRIMASGSAPITAQVQKQMQKIMGCPLIEGYGQTQATCAVIFSRATTTDFTAACQLKLCDIPQMNYTSQDTDSQGRPTPRGEIWVRGPQCFQEYYKLKDITKQSKDENGWVKTGDVGMLTPNLGLKIIDRKKHIFKLQQGEYVTPDKVERIYFKTGLLEEVFLTGYSDKNFAVAIGVPNKARLKKIGTQLSLQKQVEELCQDKQVRSTLLNELNQYGRAQGLLGFELAKNIYLSLSNFAVKGILTTTMKFMRFEARKVYKASIDAMYEQGQLKL